MNHTEKRFAFSVKRIPGALFGPFFQGTGHRGTYFARSREALLKKMADAGESLPVDERTQYRRQIAEEAQNEALAFTDARGR